MNETSEGAAFDGTSRSARVQVLPDALANETKLGLATIRSGETLAGAARFAAGEGRHGQPA